VIASVAAIVGFLTICYAMEAAWKAFDAWREQRRREKLRWKD